MFIESMIPSFVKKFDFRGEYGKEINDIDAYYLGLALNKTLSLRKVLIGWDTRRSSKNLAFNFLQALSNRNIEISYMDKCPIDYITSASFVFDFDLSVMFTGSHNPWTWTGLLMHTKGGESVQGDVVKKILNNYYECLKESYRNKNFDLSEFKNLYNETERIYGKKIKYLIPLAQIKEMKVVVDLGDGSGSKSLSLLEKLLPQVKFIRINDRNVYDEESSHTADPSNVDNMKDLISTVESGQYDCGFAFDSDADRILAVDENGKYINGSLLGSAHISSFINSGNSDKLFGYAVDCGFSTHDCIYKLMHETKNKLFVKPIPIGRSIIRQMLREGKLNLGVENVGHFYSKDFFMTDSGVFSIAVVLYWISVNGPLSTLRMKYPDGLRGQIFLPVLNESQIISLCNDINKLFDKKKFEKIDVDGIRYEFYEGSYITTWYAIRKSGYEQITKCYFGSRDESKFEFLKEKFQKLIKPRKL